MYSCKILADSIGAPGQKKPTPRLTTFEISFARIVLAETRTHRILSEGTEPIIEYLFTEGTLGANLSKSSASSRAIPVQTMIDVVQNDPYVPEDWGSAQKGMQSGSPLDAETSASCRDQWLVARDNAVASARRLLELGLAKEFVNRLLEPFSWVRQVITGTEWANFFALRTHHMAHPAFRKIAQAMYIAYTRSTPKVLQPGEWHLPYIDESDRQLVKDITPPDDLLPLPEWYVSSDEAVLCRWSVARSARTSYKLFDGKRTTPDEDERLYQRLCGATPKHAAPLEHQATPFSDKWKMFRFAYRSNLISWLQLRKTIKGENITKFNPTPEEVASWNIPEDIFA